MLRAWDASFFAAVTPAVAVEVAGENFDSRKLNRLPLSKTEKYCEAAGSRLWAAHQASGRLGQSLEAPRVFFFRNSSGSRM